RIEETRKVDATISDDIKRNAAIAVSIALVFMFIYIGIRFNNLSYGLSALISLFHDVIIVLGLYALLWGILPISLEIDEAFIGVILTVIGYSINDTVVVFDRIREYLRDHKREDTITVFNKALNSTLRRTVNTGFCTLLVLVVIYLFGGVAIKGFVFGIFFGVLVGTYSSIFIGSGIAVDLVARLERKKLKEAKYATA
ncbi:MAG: protein translocase subunit SecF, partial [Chitinophagales bacterium]|nr:protein translocase subunit SecF [Chitinophagales bacterium]